MATSTVTNSSSYLGSTGPYPVAPDTSHAAYLEHLLSSGQLNPKDYDAVLRYISTDAENLSIFNSNLPMARRMRAGYESWANNLTSQYASDIKTWETAHNSPLSQSELLEAAGYNRNWLQGAEGSQATALDYLPTPSQTQKYRDPVQDISALADMALRSMQMAMGIKQQEADVNLKNAQANEIETMIPYKMVKGYFEGLEGRNTWYGPADPGTADFFDLGSDSTGSHRGITFYGTGSNNHGTRLMSQIETLNSLRAQLYMLSREQQGFVNSKLLPFQERMNKMLEHLHQNSVTMSDWDKEIRGAAQETLKDYAGKGVEQQYILNYVRAGLDAVKTIGDLIIGFRSLGLNFKQFGLDWLDKTGEVLPGMPGY